MVLSMESVDSKINTLLWLCNMKKINALLWLCNMKKINALLWLCNMKKKMTIIPKINKVQREDKLRNLKRHIPRVSL